MKAMIFAAGYGTRLKPITDTIPKALVPLNGKPMLQHIIEKLISFQITEVVVNVHHFHQQVIDFLAQHNNFGITIHISDESKQLLDTGGGLKNASESFKGNDPILLYNVDVVSNLNISELSTYHHQNKALATLVVRDRITQRYFMIGDNNALAGWKNFKTLEERISKPGLYYDAKPYAFSGIHIIEPELLNLISGEGKFSIIDTYLELAKTRKIMGFIDNSEIWIDIGKPGQLDEASRLLKT